MREDIRGVKESIEGLCVEFHALANVGSAIVKNMNESVDYIADQMDMVTGSGDREAEGVDGVDKTIGDEGLENRVEETLQ
jgi:hypothetical protein